MLTSAVQPHTDEGCGTESSHLSQAAQAHAELSFFFFLKVKEGEKPSYTGQRDRRYDKS